MALSRLANPANPANPANSVSLVNPADQPRAFLEQLFRVAVQRALPIDNTARFLPSPPDPKRGRTLVLGAGKAGGAMAQAVEAFWPADAPLSGLVVTRYGHTPSRPAGLAQRIEVVEASHPVPDAAGLAAAERILALTQGLTEHDLVLCLISGGGSALLTLPAEGLSLAEKQRINQALLNTGAHIGEMNCVRKHLSRIKGGRLALACAPARVVTLTISDVPGDNPSVIASGPTVADETTCADALAILQRYAIDVPEKLKQLLQSGALETPKPGHPAFSARGIPNPVHLIATPQQSLQATAAAARTAGIAAYILSDEMEGESREVGKVQAAMARAVAKGTGAFERPCVILSGGETTVTVRKPPEGTPKDQRGRGGRAAEFGLGIAQALQGQQGVYVLAGDTDGIDGTEDNAGVVVSPDTLARAAHLGMKIDTYLDRNDAYGYFKPLGDLVVTGPTHTNVNDFRAILIL